MDVNDPIQTPITGGDYTGAQGTPLQALAQFYRALNARDIALMERNWTDSAEAAMDNPLGGIRRGWSQIRPAYEKLFASKGNYRFEFYDYTLHESGDVFYAAGRERGELDAGGSPMRLAIRTTRLFRRDAEGRWRQAHHHGSIDNPQMLAAYRDAVLGSGR